MIRCSARSAWGSPMPIASAWSGATAPVTSVIALGGRALAGIRGRLQRHAAPAGRRSGDRGQAAPLERSRRTRQNRLGRLRAPSSTQREPERLIDRIEVLMEEIRRLEGELADPDLFRRDPEAFAACTDRLARAQPLERSRGALVGSRFPPGAGRLRRATQPKLRRRQSQKYSGTRRVHDELFILPTGAGHVATLNQWSYQRTPFERAGRRSPLASRRRRAWKC